MALTCTSADSANISVNFYIPEIVREDYCGAAELISRVRNLSKYLVVLSKLKTKEAKILYEDPKENHGAGRGHETSLFFKHLELP